MSVTAWRYAGAGTSETFSGSIAWINPGNISASENTRTNASGAVAGVTTRPLRARSFGFTASDVPSGATILGIEVGVERYCGGLSGRDPRDSVVRLVSAGTGAAAQVGDNKANTSTAWPLTSATEAEAVYGGAADTWSAGLTQADVVSSDFGVDFQAANSTDAEASANFIVDAIRIRIHYSIALTSYEIDAGAGSFSETGQSVGLKASRRLPSAVGTLALGGSAVGLTVARKLSAGAGSLVLTGQAASLVHGGGAYTLSAGAGSVSLSGQAAGLLYGRKMPAVGTSFALSGKAVALSRPRGVTASAGSFSLSGQAVTLVPPSRRVSAGVGSFTLTGGTLRYQPITLAAAAGSLTLTGGAVTLYRERRLLADPGVFALDGASVTDPEISDAWRPVSPTAETWTARSRTSESWIAQGGNVPTGPLGFGPLAEAGDTEHPSVWTRVN